MASSASLRSAGLPAARRALIKRSQHGVVTCGDQCSHVKGGARQGATMSNVTLAAMRTAVVIVGCETGQGGGLAARQGAQFRQGGQQLPCGAWPHALDGHQSLDFACGAELRQPTAH